LKVICKHSWSASAFLVALLFCRPAKAEDPKDLTITDQAASAAAPAAPVADDDKWHVGISPYLWFAGVHGTVGAKGRAASVHASFGDIFSKLNIGLMAATEFRRNRIVIPIDYMWMKLSDDLALPVNTPNAASIKVKVNQSILTPKVGYRVVNGEKLQVNGLVGIRYFYMGNSLTLQPTSVLGGISESANWVDVVGGANIRMALSPKAVVMILGDAGGGGANSDYQVAAMLGYKIKPKIFLQAGWRYMDVNYRPSSTFVYDCATSGIVLGATFNLK
jgi:hypothetical protein